MSSKTHHAIRNLTLAASAVVIGQASWPRRRLPAIGRQGTVIAITIDHGRKTAKRPVSCAVF